MTNLVVNKDNFKEYFKEIHKRYSLIICILWSTLFSVAFFVIDRNNIVSGFIGSSKDLIIISIFSLIIALTLFFKLKLNKLMIHTLVNIIDKYLNIILGTSLILQMIIFVGYENMFPFTWVNIIVILILLLLIYLRINNVVLEEQELKSIIVDLQDILEEKITSDNPFLVRESEVDYDLLSRDNHINDLINWIENYRSNERFVVGIEGEWGSGKSTLIAIVINKIKSEDTENEFIIIDDFEPWLSENKIALLENLLNRILRNPQLQFTDEDITKIIDNISYLIFGRKISIDIKFWEKDADHSAKQIIADINKILAGSNQKIIFIIDNLDRISNENMLMLFNIVQNVLEFNNLIVVMSYDKYEVESRLKEKNISTGYLSKLVQKKVILPPPNSDSLLSIYVQTFKSLKNIFQLNTFKSFHINEIEQFLSILVSNNKLNIREFKRLLNSAIIPIMSSNSSKYLLDQFVIEYIKFSNFRLYNQILEKSDYYISTDGGAKSTFFLSKEDELDILMNTYFEELEHEYIQGDYELKLLALIFPNIDIYYNGLKRDYKNAVSEHRSSSEYIEVQKNKRISSAKFFDLYFTVNQNHDSSIINIIEDSMIGIKSKSITFPKVFEKLKLFPAQSQYDFFEAFQYYIDELETEELNQLAVELLEYAFEFKDISVFFALNIDNRIAIVVSKIFEKLDFNDYCRIVDIYIEKPRYLATMSNVIYWLDKSYTTDNTKKLDYIKSKQENYIGELLSTDAVNLYDSTIYSHGNILPVLKYIDERDEFDKIVYINQHLNNDTVFRIINDLIGVSTASSNSYNYHIISNVDKHVDVTALKEVITKAETRNDKEQFIKEVFQAFLVGEKDSFGIPKGVQTSESIDLRFV